MELVCELDKSSHGAARDEPADMMSHVSDSSSETVLDSWRGCERGEAGAGWGGGDRGCEVELRRVLKTGGGGMSDRAYSRSR